MNPAKNDCTDRDAVCVVDSGGPQEHVEGEGLDPPGERAILRGHVLIHCKV